MSASFSFSSSSFVFVLAFGGGIVMPHKIRRLMWLILWLLITTSQIYAQIDTTRSEFFPLHIGDLWQYRNQNNQLAIQRVVGDTILDGKRYFLLIHSLRTSGGGITRIDSLLRIQNRRGLPSGGDSCGGSSAYEVSIYHLAELTGSVWRICEYFWALPTPIPLVRLSSLIRINVFGEQRDAISFDFGGTVSGGSTDTIFGSGALLVRGIGIVLEQYYDSPYYALQGAIVNGVQYGTIVSVENLVETIPREFTLAQNYPNPFNPITQIKFDLPEDGVVSLKVYNPLGQEVATLINQSRTAGSYTETFDASQFASGVYIYKLAAGNFRASKKLLLMK